MVSTLNIKNSGNSSSNWAQCTAVCTYMHETPWHSIATLMSCRRRRRCRVVLCLIAATRALYTRNTKQSFSQLANYTHTDTHTHALVHRVLHNHQYAIWLIVIVYVRLCYRFVCVRACKYACVCMCVCEANTVNAYDPLSSICVYEFRVRYVHSKYITNRIWKRNCTLDIALMRLYSTIVLMFSSRKAATLRDAVSPSCAFMSLFAV